MSAKIENKEPYFYSEGYVYRGNGKDVLTMFEVYGDTEEQKLMGDEIVELLNEKLNESKLITNINTIKRMCIHCGSYKLTFDRRGVRCGNCNNLINKLKL